MNRSEQLHKRDNNQTGVNKIIFAYCAKCDIWTKSRDQMLIHKEGANYKKMSVNVQRYRCEMCLIDVPNQDTLDNHMQGKDHIKREK